MELDDVPFQSSIIEQSSQIDIVNGEAIDVPNLEQEEQQEELQR
jgi:hypothetical protein